MAKFGVIVFPGSNCDHDTYHAVKHVMNEDAKFLWHKDTDLGDAEILLVPGGFSYGDYLRSGAIARFSPIMKEVVKFAQKGGPVIGICNGFQILLEAGLVPGSMMHNRDLRFICKNTHLKCETTESMFTGAFNKNQVIELPVAHGEGNYFIDDEGLRSLEDNDQVLFRYCDENGNVNEDSNINGSVNNIAAICNKGRNVMGMMPHPERAMEGLLGNDDGRLIFESILNSLSVA